MDATTRNNENASNVIINCEQPRLILSVTVGRFKVGGGCLGSRLVT